MVLRHLSSSSFFIGVSEAESRRPVEGLSNVFYIDQSDISFEA